MITDNEKRRFAHALIDKIPDDGLDDLLCESVKMIDYYLYPPEPVLKKLFESSAVHHGKSLAPMDRPELILEE